MLLLCFFSPFCSLTASGPHPLLLYRKEFRYSVHFVTQRRNYIRFRTTLGWVNCETIKIFKANYSFKSVYPNVSLFINHIVIRHYTTFYPHPFGHNFYFIVETDLCAKKPGICCSRQHSWGWWESLNLLWGLCCKYKYCSTIQCCSFSHD